MTGNFQKQLFRKSKQYIIKYEILIYSGMVVSFCNN